MAAATPTAWLGTVNLTGLDACLASPACGRVIAQVIRTNGGIA